MMVDTKRHLRKESYICINQTVFLSFGSCKQHLSVLKKYTEEVLKRNTPRKYFVASNTSEFDLRDLNECSIANVNQRQPYNVHFV